MKEEIVLVESAQMAQRKENSFARIPKRARTSLGPGAKTLELYGERSSDRDKCSKALEIRQAFKADLQLATKLQKDGVISSNDRKRLVFVSSATFRTVAKKKLGSGVALAHLADTVEDILIGTDPEFALVESSGEFIYANQAFGHKYLSEQLGADDFGLQVELRPPPTLDHRDLVKSMQYILNNDPKIDKISNYKWLATSFDDAGSTYVGFGGHIHIGNTRILEVKDLSHAYYVVATRLLDELVAIPHSRIEGEGGIRRRNKSRFGHCGDFRNDLKPQRLEWRTIGADWIAHPELAKAVLGTAKAIVEDLCTRIVRNGYSLDYLIPPKYRKGFFAGYVNKNSEARVHFRKDLNKHHARMQEIYWEADEVNWQEFPAIDDLGLSKSSKVIESTLWKGDTTPAVAEGLGKVLRKLSTYGRYKDEIERFIDVCTRNKRTLETKLRRDLRETWIEGKGMFKK